MAVDLVQLAHNFNGTVVEVRRALHRLPEPSWHEGDTLDYIKGWIYEGACLPDNIISGMRFVFCKGEGGIWYDLIVDEKLPFVIFRADVDALKIQEENVENKSLIPGVMHACGHDANTAMLMCGMAAILDGILHHGLMPKFNIRFVFQRAEEDYTAPQGSGGKVLVDEDNVCENVVAAIGLHVWSKKANGFWTRPGPFFVNSDRIGLTVRTAGGHAGIPTGAVNALEILDNLLPRINTWPKRLVDHEDGPVVFENTVCHAGRDKSSVNIVPSEAVRWWSVRTGTQKAREAIEAAFQNLVFDINRSDNAKATLEVVKGHPAVVLNPCLVAKTALLLGEEARINHPVVTGGDDFGWYCKEVPVVFYLLGTGGIAGKTDVDHHKSKFDVDERQLVKGVEFWLKMAFELEL